MPNIAIIGTNGAGKTVFITVLAHRLNQRPTEDFVFDPDPKTFKYIETNWHILNHREWPHHTTAGNSFDLRWKVSSSTRDGLRTGEMRIIDASGHDVRAIFGDDKVMAVDTLPAAQRSVAEYCQAADIAVFVADLNDYIERPDSIQHIEDETILKSAMDFLRKHGRMYCLVLSKADLYRDYIAQQGGVGAVAALHLSSVCRSHLASGIPCFQIACVDSTESVIDGESTRIVPTPGFDSSGLDPFVDWLVGSFGSVPPPGEPLRPAPAPQSPPAPWPIVVAGAVGFFIFIAKCMKTVPGDWWHPDKTEFNPVSIFAGLVVFFVVWGILAGIRLLIRQGPQGFAGFGGQHAARGSDVEADLLVTIEEALHGGKKKISFSRDGRSQVETYEVLIPKGVRDGQKLRLAGPGESAGPRGQAGDLYLVVRFDKHPDYNAEANKNG